MKYTVEMGCAAMMYIPSFMQIGSDIPKVIVWWDLQTCSYVDRMVIE